MKYFIFLSLLLGCKCGWAQIPYTYNSSGNTSYTSGNTTLQYSNINVGSTSFNITSSAQVSLFGGNTVIASPGFVVSGLSSGGLAHLAINPSILNVASFHPNGFSGIDKYSRFEIGLQLPANIQAQVNSFLSGGSGLNPYDPAAIQVFCSYTNGSSTTLYRNGFYYRDFIEQNNMWTEQNTNYTFRVRFAPPLPGTYNAAVFLLVNGSLVSSAPFNFTVNNNGNPGHLKVDNSNLRKLQYDNGDIFFGVGENAYVGAPYPSPLSYGCVVPYPGCYTPVEYTNYRNMIKDVANNNGNFIRIRMDAMYGFPVEWEDQHIFSSETRPVKSLLNCLNNYDHNQAQMWELDQVFSTCESKDVYFILDIMDDQFWNVGNPYGITNAWSHNPYSALLGNSSTGIANFFTDTQADAYFKKLLFYITARWGYSTNLAVWEMINETDNLDGNAFNSGGNPYINNSTFKSNVNTWLCNMISYVNSFYPFHPATTGYGSDAQALTGPPCFNVFTANNYNDDIFGGNVSDGNYNSRASVAINHFNNFQPFIFGELGTACNFIDDNNDREFHNAIWATTMMGGIGCGLYWNDLDQKYGVNHRGNLNSLRTFVQRVDWTQDFQPGKVADNNTNNCNPAKSVLNFFQINGAANYIIGWSMNGSSVWAHDAAGFVHSGDFNTAQSCSGYNGSGSSYDVFTTNCNPTFKIPNLLGSTKYHVQIFDAYDPANAELTNFNEFTGLGGTLTFSRKMSFNTASPFYPDYAYIITTASNRPAPGVNPDDSLVYNPGDTLCINAAGMLEKGKYKYSWYVNQQLYSSDSLVCVQSAQHPPQIKLQLVAEDEKKVKYYKDFIFTPQSSGSALDVKDAQVFVYPNPAKDFIEIAMNNMPADKFEVIIQNELGQTLIKKSMLNRINTESLSNGFYVVKIICGSEERSVKLIISR